MACATDLIGTALLAAVLAMQKIRPARVQAADSQAAGHTPGK
jgi:hypothetical protein